MMEFLVRSQVFIHTTLMEHMLLPETENDWKRLSLQFPESSK
jgi:hypothetical protein